MRMVLILILALAISGCAIYPYPVYSSLGVIDVSKTGSLLETTFVCPKDPSSFTLVFHDSKGKERSFCAHPGWPIILQFDLFEETGTNSILTKRLTGNQMQFTNWQLPSTSVAFDLPYLKPLLQAERKYMASIQASDPYVQPLFLRRTPVNFSKTFCLAMQWEWVTPYMQISAV